MTAASFAQCQTVRTAVAMGLLATVLTGSGSVAHAADPDALWKIVHDKCSVMVAPCTLVDTNERFALLKDLRGIAQVLLIPTDRITGIEAPQLRDPATPNFFADAWAHQNAMQARLPAKVPRQAVGLAVNASNARSQNQLHVHIDCLRPDVRDVLARLGPGIRRDWGPLPEPIVGHAFYAMRVDGEDLGAFNPFLALAVRLKDPDSEMALHNLVVAGAEFADGPGFIILTDTAPAAVYGYAGGEDIQDHDCAIANPQ
jgi:CDP-diacylglycerol pyrophosphatase